MKSPITIIEKAQLHGCAFFVGAVALSALMASCAKEEKPQPGPETLVMIDGEELTAKQLAAAMPGGLNSADSAKLADAYIKSWINSRIITKIATGEIDMAPIEKQVEQYRRELIMNEYTRLMCVKNGATIVPEDSIKAYYDAHASELLLRRPLVKGVYLKIADNSPSLPQLRKLYRSHKDADIDKLDKSELNGAVHYDFFRDRWIDWEQIESRVPYDFGSPDAFLRGHKNLDIQADGFTYLLDISDVLFTGQPMPYETAKPLIEERLEFYGRRDYQERLLSDLLDRAVATGKVYLAPKIE